jgi:phosphomannomutase
MLQKKYGCEVVRTEVGEINIVEEIIKLNAIIGSEGNGGIIYLK